MKITSLLKKVKATLVLGVALSFIGGNVLAQNVGIGTTTPDASSILELNSTTLGFLVPRMTSTEKTAIGTPATGLLIYQTDAPAGFWYYDGSTWTQLGGSAGWELTGNASTTPGTGAGQNFIGTTDAQDWIMATNGTQRMRITSGGQVTVNNTGAPIAGDVFSSYAASTDYAISGYSVDGVAIYGGTTGAGITAYFDNAGTGIGEWVSSTASFASINFTTPTTATAIIGANSGNALYLPTGSGGAFTGMGTGVFARGLDSTSAGTGYSASLCYQGEYGQTNLNVAGFTDMYHFGNYGLLEDHSAAGAGSRVGGSFGMWNHTGFGLTSWGVLGYVDAATAFYGGYFNGGLGTDIGAGTGKSTGSGNNQIGYAGIGVGAYGDLYGAWSRGSIYGFATSGTRYGLYVDGKTYVNNEITQISTTTTGERVASYVPTSTSMDVYAKGKGELVNGTATITFDANYSKLIGNDVVVTVTPMGQTKGVYIVSADKNGFTIQENDGGNASVQFTWIAVGTKFNASSNTIPAEVMLADYDEKLRGFMHNENDTQNKGQAMYFDGQNLIFDSIFNSGIKMNNAFPKAKVSTLKSTQSKKLTKESSTQTIK